MNPTTYGIGNAFLETYALPFELASIVLLAALIGAMVISRPVKRPVREQGRVSVERGTMPGGLTLNHFLVLSLIIFAMGCTVC